MCDWVTLPYSRKLTEHCKPSIMEKIKIIKKKKLYWPNKASVWIGPLLAHIKLCQLERKKCSFLKSLYFPHLENCHTIMLEQVTLLSWKMGD